MHLRPSSDPIFRCDVDELVQGRKLLVNAVMLRVYKMANHVNIDYKRVHRWQTTANPSSYAVFVGRTQSIQLTVGKYLYSPVVSIICNFPNPSSVTTTTTSCIAAVHFPGHCDTVHHQCGTLTGQVQRNFCFEQLSSTIPWTSCGLVGQSDIAKLYTKDVMSSIQHGGNKSGGNEGANSGTFVLPKTD